MKTYWLLNGKINAQLDPRDRGFSYGDGVFSTLAWRCGKLEFVEDHLLRLEKDAQQLNMNFQRATLVTELTDFVEYLQQENKTSGVIKIILSRGIGQRGFFADPTSMPTRCILFQPLSEEVAAWQTHGITMRLCHRRLSPSPVPGAKHLNCLEYVLARSEWSDAQIQQGLLLNNSEQIVEASSANIFWLRDGCWYTPNLQQQGVHGVIRGRVLRYMRAKNIAHTCGEYYLTDLLAADEVFVCNSVMRVVPVVSLFIDDEAKHSWDVKLQTSILQRAVLDMIN